LNRYTKYNDNPGGFVDKTLEQLEIIFLACDPGSFRKMTFQVLCGEAQGKRRKCQAVDPVYATASNGRLLRSLL